MTPAPDDRTGFARFAADEAERLNTLPLPAFHQLTPAEPWPAPPSPPFAKPSRAPYEAPEGWRSWVEFTRYLGGADAR